LAAILVRLQNGLTPEPNFRGEGTTSSRFPMTAMTAMTRDHGDSSVGFFAEIN
jgi:hypothetical protein